MGPDNELTGINIKIESPKQADVIKMIEELDRYLNSRYPPESNQLLGIDELNGPNVRFFVARRDGKALGCGALRIDESGYGEINRMFVLPVARGLKLGRLILNWIENQARHEELTCLRLETGIHQPEALGLYRTAGFTEREPFGSHKEDPLNVYMEKILYASE